MALLGGLVLVAAACGGSDEAEAVPLSGVVREPSPDVSEIVLPDAADGGRPRTMQAEPGGVLLVNFGFTSCPDVCPTTMSDVAGALEELDGEERARVEVAMATVDPGRDTDELLTRYVRTFVAEGGALRTDDPEALRAAADAFGADYAVTDTGQGEPEVAHSAWVYAVDGDGLLRVQWAFGTTSTEMADDLRTLLADPSVAGEVG